MILLLILVTVVPVLGQSSGAYQEQLSKTEIHKNQGDLKEASRFLNEAAMEAWERKEYRNAVKFFNESLKLNWEVKNLAGMSKIQSNLGLIFADSGDHSMSVINFEKSLAYRRQTGDKAGVISTLINLSVAFNSLGDHQIAVEHLDEALELATEMNDPQVMKGCYIMLSETYQKLGDNEQTLHYFNLYRTFHEMVQRDKEIKLVKQIELEKRRSLQNALAKKDSELELLAKIKALSDAEDRLKYLNTETQELVRALLDSASKQELAIELLKSENQLKESRISEAHTESKNQRMLVQMISIGLVGLLMITFLLLWNYWYKKKTNARLRKQNNEIKDLNENLEKLVEHRTKELRSTLKRLRDRNQDLDQFAHVISHNLRAPVAQILGLYELFTKEDPRDASNLEIFTHMDKSVKYLDAVIKDLNKILVVKDNLHLPQEVVNVPELVDTVKHSLFGENGLKGVLKTNFSEIQVINTVRSYLESIVLHLLDNAVKYRSRSRALFIHVKSAVEQDYFVLTIADNGIGIPLPAPELHKIFQPYKRMNVETMGKGIGLYLVKSQVEALHGKIEVVNEEGKGCTFKVLLPLKNQDLATLDHTKNVTSHE